MKAVIDAKPDCNLHLIVYGTPAEEWGGGKILMIEKGVFDEVDICMSPIRPHVKLQIHYGLELANTL